jgi:hypothetical protein
MVGDAFRGQSILRAGFFDPTNEGLAFVMGPMANFVRKRKPLSPEGTLCINCDDGCIITTDDPRLASVKSAKADAGAKMKRYGLKIDFLRFGDPQFLKQPLGRRERRHD